MVLRGQDAWRKHPIFKWNMNDVLPGFREATVLFGFYVGTEWAIEKYRARGVAKAHAGATAAHTTHAVHATH